MMTDAHVAMLALGLPRDDHGLAKIPQQTAMYALDQSRRMVRLLRLMAVKASLPL